jgi:hypothetical protein
MRKRRLNKAAPPSRRPRLTFRALREPVYPVCAPPASPAAVGEPRRWVLSMKPAYFIPLCLMLVGCAHFAQHRRAEIYEFPEGFHGWAVIVWGAPGHPRSQTDHGKLIVRFPADGVVITSTKLELDSVRDGAYFFDSAGRRLSSQPAIAFAGNGFMHHDASGRDMDYTQVFVGTKAEFRATPDAPQVERLWSSSLGSR